MRKIVLLSFDDGTVYDPRFAALLDRYHIPCTFNLNAGLEEFVWYYEDRHPIRRQKLADAAAQGVYRGHEIASHTLTHPWLTSLSEEALDWEVGQDCRTLKALFGVKRIGFAVPFTACGEREINVIRRHAAYVRLSEYTDSFALPEDAYHIRINALYNDSDIRQKLDAFAQSTLPVSLFVICGHSYEFEVLDHWQYIERLLQHLRGFSQFEFMTTMQFVEQVLYAGKEAAL